MTLNDLMSELAAYHENNLEQTAYMIQRLNHPEQAINHNAHQPMHIASAFKAIVAAAVCQALEEALNFDNTWTITSDERLPDSTGTDEFADGHLLTVSEALKLMIGVSDNTTTEMIMRRIDTQRIISQLHMQETYIPPLLSNFINRALKKDAEWSQFSPKSSVADLTHFYQTLYQHDFFRSAETKQLFWEIMREEDRIQAPKWGEDVTCYRKSGSLELNGFYALSIAGIMANQTDAFAFGIVYNCHENDEEKAVAHVQKFSMMASTLLRGLNRLLQNE